MNEYGVRLKGEEYEELLFTGRMAECYSFSTKQQEADGSLKDRWRIGLLPRYLVRFPTPDEDKIIGAFETQEEAILFTQDYLARNADEPKIEDVYIAY